jgi:glycosyltransferase involved in cell wall biosynthesis
MTAEKGVRLLGSIAERLAPLIRTRVRLVLLGGKASGPLSLGGVEAYAAGFVDEIHAAMAGLDLLWHPSSAEGLGTAVIDAMALGIPPIAFGVGGLPELIVDGESGRLVPAGDVDAFANAVAMLVSDDHERARLSAGGPPRASEFSVDRMVRGTDAAYQTVLAG